MYMHTKYLKRKYRRREEHEGLSLLLYVIIESKGQHPSQSASLDPPPPSVEFYHRKTKSLIRRQYRISKDATYMTNSKSQILNKLQILVILPPPPFPSTTLYTIRHKLRIRCIYSARLRNKLFSVLCKSNWDNILVFFLTQLGVF